jgi:hypothetical protein
MQLDAITIPCCRARCCYCGSCYGEGGIKSRVIVFEAGIVCSSCRRRSSFACREMSSLVIATVIATAVVVVTTFAFRVTVIIMLLLLLHLQRLRRRRRRRRCHHAL